MSIDDVDIDGAIQGPLDWEFHPVGLPIGDHAHRYNEESRKTAPAAMGVVKCPGLCFLPVMFGRAVMRGWRRTVYKAVFGPRVWITVRLPNDPLSDGRHWYFADQWGLFFDCFRPSLQWFVLAEMTCSMLLSVFAMVPVSSRAACHTRNVSICILLGLFLALLCWKRPYQSMMDNAVVVPTALMVFSAVVTPRITGAPTPGNGGTFPLLIAGADLLLASAVLISVKVAIDFAAYAYDIRQRAMACMFSSGVSADLLDTPTHTALDVGRRLSHPPGE
eukprot:gene44261-4716_t